MWKNQQARETAEKIIEELLNNHVRGGGIELSLKTVIGKIELSSLSKNLTRNEILRILPRMKRKGKTGIDEFEKCLKLLRQNRKIKSWTFYIPIPINLKKRKFRLLGVNFAVKSKSTLIKEKGNVEFYKYLFEKKIDSKFFSDPSEKFFLIGQS